MNSDPVLIRLLAKTPQQKFLQTLLHDFHYPPKVAEAILSEAQDCFQGTSEHLRPGQVRVVLTQRQARHGQALGETPKKEITWTVDAGSEDRQVQHQHGSRALRQVRLQRLLDEALEQGALASQEDLAQALHTSTRTIKRDFAQLQAQGQLLPSRGYLQGIGRGQTHKGQIIARWLRGETFDQLERHTRHSPTAIQRYLRTFLQVVELHRLGWPSEQIAHLLQVGQPLVADYLRIYQHNDQPACRERLEAQLKRFRQAAQPKKGAQ